MINQTPKFQEEYSAKLPAMALLTQLGWTFIPRAEAITLRSGNTGEVVLRDILRGELKKRRFTFNGEEHGLPRSHTPAWECLPWWSG